MQAARRFVRRLVTLFRLGPAESDLDREIRSHLQLLEDRFIEQGMTAAEARVAARRALGGVEQVKEAQRDARTFRWLAGLPMDLKLGARALSRRPAASIATALVLALGVGLAGSMFALADPYILKPLPYQNPDELVVITVRSTGVTREATIPTFAEWSSRTDVFQGLAAYSHGSIRELRYTDRSVMVATDAVSPNFFEVLGVPVSHTADWRDPTVLPRPAIVSNPQRLMLPPDALAVGTYLPGEAESGIRIAGATRLDFLYPEPGRGQTIAAITSYQLGDIISVGRWDPEGRPRSTSSPLLLGRLQPGVTPSMTRAALASALPSGGVLDVVVVPLRERMTGDRQRLAWGALGAGLLVLLVCAGNVANLWMAQGVHRAHETATRTALGASRLDVLRLWMVEAAVIAAVALVCGVVVAGLVLAGAGQVMPEAWATLGRPALTGRVVVFCGVVGVVVAFLGMLPGFLRQSGAATLSPSSAIFREPGRVRALRVGFTAAQAAMTVVLVIGAALLGRSLLNIVGQEPGFNDDVVAVTVAYPNDVRDESLAAALDDTMRRLRGVPGIDDVAFAHGNVVRGMLRTSVHAGRALDGTDRMADARLRIVSPNYFDVAGMHFAEGRGFRPGDDLLSAVVNEAFVREYYEGHGAVGRVLGGASIVGVVRDAFEETWTERAESTVYELRGLRSGGVMTLVLRIDGDPLAFRPAVQRALFETNPGVILIELETLGGKLAGTVQDRSFVTLVLVTFGVVGAAVAVAGLVGVVGFVVARRTREIAIRSALGAERRHLRRLVLGETLAAAVGGSVIGLFAGRWASAGLESFVYGVAPGDWTTTALAGLATVLVMVVAASVPARRAARLSPTVALRID